MKRTSDVLIEDGSDDESRAHATESPFKKLKTTADGESGSSSQASTSSTKAKASRSCPWLGTVDRSILEFDFEKVCSVSLKPNNIYACLVCGKYYQGRGRSSHAYIHSVAADHHVFLNLQTKRFYCLPDDYEIIDSSLNDITGLLDPEYTPEIVQSLDTTPTISRTLDGSEYSVGIMGINNMDKNDYISVVFQALAHVPLLRNFFLLPKNYDQYDSALGNTFGTILRRYWYAHAFKNHISLHELLQAVSERAGKKFAIGKPGKPLEFLMWFLNTLHRDMKGSRKLKSSIVNQCFQGRIEITTEVEVKTNQKNQTIVAAPVKAGTDPLVPAVPTKAAKPEKKMKITKKEVPFLVLSADMPPPPLFPDGKKRTNIIPQEPLFTLLEKFNGEQKQFVAATNEWRRFKITRLPRYLILHINRFTNNLWYEEKNPTIVNFPLKELDMGPYTTYPANHKLPTKYNLIANIRHYGKPDDATYRLHLLNKSEEKWYDIQDLIVESVMPPEVVLSEAFIQIYELQV